MGLLGVLGAGLGISILGAHNQAEAVKDSARFNAAQAEEDVKLIQLSEKHALRDTRFQGVSDLANIESAIAASGVNVSTGSALSAIRFQAEENSRNESAIALESRIAQQNRRTGATLEVIKARNQASGIMLGAAGQALSTGATFAAARG